MWFTSFTEQTLANHIYLTVEGNREHEPEKRKHYITHKTKKVKSFEVREYGNQHC